MQEDKVSLLALPPFTIFLEIIHDSNLLLRQKFIYAKQFCFVSCNLKFNNLNILKVNEEKNLQANGQIDQISDKCSLNSVEI